MIPYVSPSSSSSRLSSHLKKATLRQLPKEIIIHRIHAFLDTLSLHRLSQVSKVANQEIQDSLNLRWCAANRKIEPLLKAQAVAPPMIAASTAFASDMPTTSVQRLTIQQVVRIERRTKIVEKILEGAKNEAIQKQIFESTSLGEDFEKAVEDEETYKIYTMIASPRFQEISASNLTKGFGQAVRKEYEDISYAIIHSGRFTEIDPKALGHACFFSAIMTAFSKKFYIIKEIILSGGFAKISDVLLGRLFWAVSFFKKSEKRMAREMINSACFARISADSLGKTLCQIVDHDGFEIFRAIIRSNRFGDISADHLGQALQNTASHPFLEDNFKIVNEIIYSGRFPEISADHLGQALQGAVSKRNRPIIQAIIDSGRFPEISADHLGQTLQGAVSSADVEIVIAIVKAIIRSNRFGEISAGHLSQALRRAVSSADVEIVNTILNAFYKVSFGGLCEMLQQLDDAPAIQNLIIEANHFAPSLFNGLFNGLFRLLLRLYCLVL